MKSIEHVNCFLFLERQEELSTYLLGAVGNLFLNAMIIALPVMGTLILIHITMELLTKTIVFVYRRRNGNDKEVAISNIVQI